MIRTLAEVHADRVTVTVTLDDSLSGRLYTAEEVGDFQASEAELVAGPLRRRITELETRLANGTADEVDRLARQVRDLKRRNSDLATQMDRHVRTLNDQEGRHAAASQQYAQSLASRDRLLAAATTKLRLARERGLTEEARDDIYATMGHPVEQPEDLARRLAKVLVSINELTNP